MEDTEVQDEVAEEVTEDEAEGDDGKDSKTWFPYITKAQFEKFVSRLQTKMELARFWPLTKNGSMRNNHWPGIRIFSQNRPETGYSL